MIKLKLTANNIISIVINIIIIFLWFKTKPQIPIRNNNIENVKYCIRFIVLICFKIYYILLIIYYFLQ